MSKKEVDMSLCELRKHYVTKSERNGGLINPHDVCVDDERKRKPTNASMLPINREFNEQLSSLQLVVHIETCVRD